MPRELTQQQLTERSVTKKFRKEIWNTFIEGTQRYRLIEDGDRVAVCLDGGANTLLEAKLLQQLKRVSDTAFETVFFAAPAGDRVFVENQAAALGIPLTATDAPNANNAAHALGCNKLTAPETRTAVVLSALRDVLYRSRLEAIPPRELLPDGKTEIIRPLYCVGEDAVRAFVRYNSLDCLSAPEEDRELQAVRRLAAEQAKINPLFEHNVFTGLHAVCRDTLPGYIENGEIHSFLDNYDAE